MAKRWLIRLIKAIPFAWGIFFLWYIHPRGDGAPGSIVVLQYPGLLELIYAILRIFWWVGFFLFLLNIFLKRKLGSHLYFISVLVILFIIGLFGLVGYSLDLSWPIMASLQAPNGRNYYAITFGFAGASTDALSEEISRDKWFIRTRLLGGVDAEGGAEWTPLVLPKSAALKKLIRTTNLKRPVDNSSLFGRTYGKLVHSPDGNMIIFIYEKTPYLVQLPRRLTVTCMAYDIRGHKFYGFPQPARPDYPEYYLSEISPFILFGPSDEPDSNSLEITLSFIENQKPEYRYESNFAALINEQKNPNTHVRFALTQMLGNYWTEHRDAAEILNQMTSNDADPKVRAAAKGALDKLKGLVEKPREELKSLDRGADSPPE